LAAGALPVEAWSYRVREAVVKSAPLAAVHGRLRRWAGTCPRRGSGAPLPCSTRPGAVTRGGSGAPYTRMHRTVHTLHISWGCAGEPRPFVRAVVALGCQAAQSRGTESHPGAPCSPWPGPLDRGHPRPCPASRSRSESTSPAWGNQGVASARSAGLALDLVGQIAVDLAPRHVTRGETSLQYT